MSDGLIHTGENRSPAELQSEVVRLRNECTLLLEELETRVKRTLRLPQRLRRSAKQLEEEAREWLREHPSWGIALGVAAATVLLGGAYIRRVQRSRFVRRHPVRRMVRLLAG
ncbi:MAG TPA: hypothetical protein VH877_06025 [Polyangia bacterium]|jgi:ElaB/YqjD/DUF883 family membrane-anchored ribosome-binding protein|nr:hypothetical protein [Polyangia bacterium]